MFKNLRSLAAALALVAILVVPAASRLEANPASVAFTHGVASGDVTPLSALLWTRVDQHAWLTVEVARNPSFSPPVISRETVASAAHDFTIKQLVAPLAPGSRHYYRFRAGSSVSEVGTFKTAPLPGSSQDVRFAWTGDSDGTLVGGMPSFNDFPALRASTLEAPDFFAYLGDTVYSDSSKRTTGPATTLEAYRDTYKVNRDYTNLRQLLAATSTYAVWDDHEVYDDFAGQTVDPQRYAAGREAFLEYMPVIALPLPRDATCAGPPMFRAFKWGAAVDVIIPDERSCRSAKIDDVRAPDPATCNGDLAPTLPAQVRAQLGAFFPTPPTPACLAALNDPSRTMLGASQKRLFKEVLLRSTGKFKFVLSEVTIQQTFVNPYDRWEGYGAERAEILNFIRDNNIKNVIFLSADGHHNLINEVFIDRFSDPTPIATEFVTGPVAHYTDQQSTLNAFGPVIGPLAVGGKQQILSLAGVDCRHLDKYSYGVVEVNAAAGSVTVTLKDDSGAVIHDQLNPAVPCVRTIGT